MGVINWGKVLSNLSVVIEAEESQYFDLMSFCHDRSIDYNDLKGFYKIGKKIVNGNLDLTKNLRNEMKCQKDLLKKLNDLNLIPD